MTFIPDVRRVLLRAWSLRLIELAALADLILNLAPFVADWLPWWLTVALLIAAWGARLMAQPDGQPEMEASNAD